MIFKIDACELLADALIISHVCLGHEPAGLFQLPESGALAQRMILPGDNSKRGGKKRLDNKITDRHFGTDAAHRKIDLSLTKPPRSEES